MELLQPSPEDRRRAWITTWEANGGNVARSAHEHGISRQTLYRWIRRYRTGAALADRSHSPQRPRTTWTTELVDHVARVRREFGWGRDKIGYFLRNHGIDVSPSTVGRILAHLRHQGEIPETPPQPPRRRRQTTRPRATSTHPPSTLHPGLLLQVDDMEIRVGSQRLRQFTFIDVASRQAVLEIATRKTATAAARAFLAALKRLSFRPRSVQVDGGSEFRGAFARVCRRLGIELRVLPPASPWKNGRVERLHRTCRAELYGRVLVTITARTTRGIVRFLRAAARQWESLYNRFRPHRALNYLAPEEIATAKTRAVTHHPDAYTADEHLGPCILGKYRQE